MKTNKNIPAVCRANRAGRHNVWPRGGFFLLSSLLVACKGPEPQIYPASTTDVFTQEPLRKTDILLVIDSSGSMEEEQGKLSRNFKAFIQAFSDAKVDYHISVATTDLDNQEVIGQLQGDTKVITPDTPDAEAVFAENVQVGTNGSGLEMGFEAAKLVLSEPRISTTNSGFYRQDASLSLVFFSDENDMSPGSVDDYLNFFSKLKGQAAYRNHDLMNISAVVGDVPYGCESEDDTGIASAGTRYVDAATRTGGVFASICSQDFAPIVQALGLDISGLKDEFPLTRCARPDTLYVIVQSATDEADAAPGCSGDPSIDIGAGRLVEQGIAYTYLPERKSIKFSSNWVPGPEEEIVVSYDFYPEDTLSCPTE